MRRLSSTLVPLLAAGCLAPQEIDEAVPDDGDRNHAPRIVVDQALVEGMAVSRLHVQDSCKELRFRLGAIEDLDVEDTLHVRFFVDYDLGCEGCQEIQDSFELQATATTRELRTTDFEFTLPLLSLGLGTHLVEAWVSDGPADEDVAPVNRAVLPGRGVDTVVWTIVVVDGETQECLPDPA